MAEARSAQAEWAQTPPLERSKVLRRLRQAVAGHMDQLIQTISEETGKPPLDALTGDVMVTLEHLRFYESRAPRLLEPRRKGKPWFFFSGTQFLELPEPHGVVLVFAPWNYPLQLALVPAATALFAGNAVLLKASEYTPRTAGLIQALCEEARLLPGLVHVSFEAGNAAAALLEASPDFVFFTGSTRNGRHVAKQAAASAIPVALELGGKDAALVFASCNLERTIEGTVFGSFSNAGQVCVGIKRLYVEQSIYNEFVRRFVDRTLLLRIGQTLESDLGPVVIPGVSHRLWEQVEDALAHGATLHTGSKPGSPDVQPIVLTNVPSEARLLTEESFGPVVCIAPFRDEAEAIAMANASEFALSASIWTANRAQGQRVAHQLDSGSCAINDVIRNIGNPYAAFGGNRASGYGRYHGEEGLRTFSRIKTIMIVEKQRRIERHWFPYRAPTMQMLRRLLAIRHGKRAGRLGGLLRVWAILISLACSTCFAQASSGSLAIEVRLPSHAHGQIAYLVFAAPAGFPDNAGRAVRHGFIPIANQNEAAQRIAAGDLPPGRYAVSVFLDTNQNRKLDKNWMGIPREPVGASNNPRERMGPPRFEECAFQHGATPQTVSITLVH